RLLLCPLTPPLFPYTTLFRSGPTGASRASLAAAAVAVDDPCEERVVERDDDVDPAAASARAAHAAVASVPARRAALGRASRGACGAVGARSPREPRAAASAPRLDHEPVGGRHAAGGREHEGRGRGPDPE